MFDEVKEINQFLDQATNVLNEEAEASRLAKASVEQLDSLIVEGWNKGGQAFVNALKDVNKVIENDRDIVTYGKAIAIARHYWEHRFYDIKSTWRHKFKSLYSSKYREQSERTEEMVLNAVTYIVLLKIKRDLIERYELR